MAKELKVEMIETKWGQPAARHTLVDIPEFNSRMPQDNAGELDLPNELEDEDDEA